MILLASTASRTFAMGGGGEDTRQNTLHSVDMAHVSLFAPLHKWVAASFPVTFNVSVMRISCLLTGCDKKFFLKKSQNALQLHHHTTWKCGSFRSHRRHLWGFHSQRKHSRSKHVTGRTFVSFVCALQTSAGQDRENCKQMKLIAAWGRFQRSATMCASINRESHLRRFESTETQKKKTTRLISEFFLAVILLFRQQRERWHKAGGMRVMSPCAEVRRI